MITVREARSEKEVRAAAACCWPHLQSGQAAFGLEGMGSEQGLTRAWLALLAHPTDAVLLAELDAELVGGCGLFVSDSVNLQTVNGPIAFREHAAVYDALLDDILARYPGGRVRVGVSHRHVRAMAWLQDRQAVLEEHAWPYTGRASASGPVRGIRVLGPADNERFVALYDRLLGTDVGWTAAEILHHPDSWIRLTDGEWTSVLAARIYPESSASEVFSISAPDVDATTALVRGWLTEAAHRGLPDAVFFCGSETECAAASRCGLTCDDEYFSFLVG